MMRRLLAFLLVPLLLGNVPAATCPSNGWCNTWSWQANGSAVTDNGWGWMVFVPGPNAFYAYENDTTTIVTFENALIKYTTQSQQALSDPWSVDSGCGTTPSNAINNDNTFLASDIGATDSTITVNYGQHQTTLYPASGYMVVEDEVFAYSAVSPNTIGATSNTFTVSQRGARGTTAVAHLARNPGQSNNTYVVTACPAPKVNVGGTILAANDFSGDRHPVHSVYVDNKRGRVWWAGMYYENRQYDEVWYRAVTVNSYNTQNDVNAGAIRFPVVAPYTSTAGRLPQRQEGQGVYDEYYDALVYYGGLQNGSSADDLWILPLNQVDPQPDGKNIGVTVLNKWNQITYAGGSAATNGRNGAVMRYDPDRHKIYMFGGVDRLGAMSNLVWIYDTGNRTWSSSAPAPVVGRKWPAFTYERIRHLAVLYDVPGSIYTWNPDTNTWATVAVAGGPTLWTADGSGNNASINLDHDYVHDVLVLKQSPNRIQQSWPRPETWQLPGMALGDVSGELMSGSGTVQGNGQIVRP